MYWAIYNTISGFYESEHGLSSVLETMVQDLEDAFVEDMV